MLSSRRSIDSIVSHSRIYKEAVKMSMERGLQIEWHRKTLRHVMINSTIKVFYAFYVYTGILQKHFVFYIVYIVLTLIFI